MQTLVLPEKIRRLYDKLNKTVVGWRYTSARMDRIEVELSQNPPILDEWEHNGMSWQLVKSPRR